MLSVFEQTYRNIEYIIIDGGSTDGTLDIIRKYDDRVAYWVSEPDRGIYEAMNKGIDAASGDWVNFMNAGDRFYSVDAVERVFSAPGPDADLVYGHCQMVYSPQFALIWRAKEPADLWKGMIFRHQSLFARRSVLRKLPFSLDYRIGADFNFIYSSYRSGFTLKNVDIVISTVTAGGVSDEHLVLGTRESWQTVARYDNTLKVNCYYRWLILLIHVKRLVKKILPAWIQNRVRALKYR